MYTYAVIDSYMSFLNFVQREVYRDSYRQDH